MEEKKTRDPGREALDLRILVPGVIVCFTFVIWCMLDSVHAGESMSFVMGFLSDNFGWLYLIAVFVFVVFLLGLAFSKLGKVKLGKDDEEPEYKTSSWLFMMFSAGMGIGLVFWSVGEPMSLYLNPPIQAGSTVAAAQEAMPLTFMHWGITPWACYGVVGLILAYFQYRKGRSALLGSCLAFGGARSSGTYDKLALVVDILAVIVTIFGVSTSLGMGALQISAGLNYAFGVPNTIVTKLAVVAVATVVFVASGMAGIGKGMKRLSDLNITLAAILCLLVFLSGSMVFILDFFAESIGAYLQNFIQMSLWADAFGEAPGFLSSWTVFYWAWWISWTPFVGSFVAHISRGRTIREFIACILLAPAIISFIFMTVMGGNAIAFDLGGNQAIATAMEGDVSYALFALFNSLPVVEGVPLFALALSAVAIVLIFVFFVTSADSATFICAQQTCGGSLKPPARVKAVWGLVLAAVSAMLLCAGGLSSLQTVSIVAAFPFIFVIFALMISFIRVASHEFDATGGSDGDADEKDGHEPLAAFPAQP